MFSTLRSGDTTPATTFKLTLIFGILCWKQVNEIELLLAIEVARDNLALQSTLLAGLVLLTRCSKRIDGLGTCQQLE